MTETELIERLERLERAHRWLKGFAVAAVVLLAAIVTIDATQPVPQVIRARKFEVVDNSGKVRVSMDLGDQLWGPEIKLFASGPDDPFAAISIGLLNGQPGITVHDPLSLGYALISVDLSGGPGIYISDGQGFEMDLGNTQTVVARTGETQQTSAASIIMFDNSKKHHAIWQAP